MLLTKLLITLSIMNLQSDTLELKLNETAKYNDLHITLTQIVFETIAASPEDEQAYPEGSGVTISLSLKKGIRKKDISLDLLSAPYSSKLQDQWMNYKITLTEVGESNAKIIIENIVKLE